MELFVLYFKGLAVSDVYLSLKTVFILANIADPDKMLSLPGSSLFANIAVN